MANPEQPYQPTAGDVVDAEAMMTDAKREASGKRLADKQKLEGLLTERHMTAENLERIKLGITGDPAVGPVKLEGSIIGRDGQSYILEMWYKIESGNNVVIGRILIDNKEIEGAVSKKEGVDLVRQWGPIAEALKIRDHNSDDSKSSVYIESEKFKAAEIAKALDKRRDAERALINNLL